MPRRRLRQRQLRRAGTLATTVLAGALALAGMAVTATAERPSPDPSASPTQAKHESPSPCGFFEGCASPTPSLIVITPVPTDTPSPGATPAYLIGLSPSPTDTGALVPGSPIPLGGAGDELPSPVAEQNASGTDSGVRSGLPVPFLVVGLLLMVAAGGALVFALAPKKPAPTPIPVQAGKPASPVMFTPTGTSLADAPLHRPRPSRAGTTRKKPRSRPKSL